MGVLLNPYLSFRDNAREALEFYRSVLGGELTLSTFGENGMSDDPALQDCIMHGMLEAPNGLVLMAADTPPGMDFVPAAGISISLSGDDEKALRGYWDGLLDGGALGVPLETAPWGDTFGMCTDRYGIGWMVNILGSSS